MSRSLSKKQVVKKSISLRSDVYKDAEKMAEKLFGGNFSAYLTYLICADKHGLSVNKYTGEQANNVKESSKKENEHLEKVEEIENRFQKSEENEEYINDILNGL